MRFLIFILLFYLGYRYFKSLTAGRTVTGSSPEAAERIEDILVQDPFCQIYVPKREALSMKIEGQTLYFCSEECRLKFTEARLKTDA
jgi:YHS domain-containing protein